MMNNRAPFDLAAAHKYFSVECFNSTWNLIDKPIKTPGDEEQMLLRTFASFYHWTQREDCAAENRSVALWQVSRVYALLGQAENARRYGEQCLAESDSPGLPPYCLGYAYEALARAAMVGGNKTKMREYLALAHSIAEKMADEEDREILLSDLAAIK